MDIKRDEFVSHTPRDKVSFADQVEKVNYKKITNGRCGAMFVWVGNVINGKTHGGKVGETLFIYLKGQKKSFD